MFQAKSRHSTAFRRAAAALALTAALVSTGCNGQGAEANAEPKPPSAAPAKKAEITTPDVIPNFTLADQNGKSHELYKITNAKAIVMVMEGVGCPIVQQMTPDIKDVQAAYEKKGIKFLMLNSNNQDTREMIAGEAKNFEINMPILKDEGQKVAEPLGVQRTAETFVIQPGTWKILYHGALNDRLTYGRAKARASENYVIDVLEAVLKGGAIPPNHQMADGCIIDFPARQKG